MIDHRITFTGEDQTTTAAPTGGLGEVSTSTLPQGAQEVRFMPARWLPAEQEYYWSEAWQGGEMESLRELASGGAVRFDTTDDLLHWLFSADGDED